MWNHADARPLTAVGTTYSAVDRSAATKATSTAHVAQRRESQGSCRGTAIAHGGTADEEHADDGDDDDGANDPHSVAALQLDAAAVTLS